MKKRMAKESLDEAKALEILYGSDIRDLTSSGYANAMNKLRRTDTVLARRVERILAPVLERRFFTRRKRKWFETSEGTRVRLALLSQNPYVQTDLKAVREILGIPQDHVTTTKEHPLWYILENDVRPDGIRRVIEGNLTSEWLHIHRMAALELPIETGEVELLPVEMRESAVSCARKDLSTEEAPEWLHRFDDTEAGKEKLSPIDWTARKLVQRHRLPKHVSTPMTFFILTQDYSWLEELEPLSISVIHNESLDDEESFDVIVRRIDEFLTKEDWNRIWINHVKPRQAYLWERRGMKPQGRRTLEIDRLKRILPLYQRMVIEHLQIKDILRHPLDDLTMEDYDLGSVRRALHDLQVVLTPLP